jgi:glycosyltransferase involved in cell wall biosynthesis
MRYQKIIETVYIGPKNKSQSETRIRVLLIAYPSIPENPHLTELIKILTPVTTRLFIFTSNYAVRQTSDAHVFVKNSRYIARARSLPSKIANYLLFQLQSAHFLISNASSFDICVFHIGTTLVLPMLLSKLVAKRSLLYLSGSQAQLTEQTYGETLWGRLLCRIIAVVEAVNMRLATMLVAYSAASIKEQKLERYMSKIAITAARFVDTDVFKLQTPIEDRQNAFGYVGRLSREKGILNLVDAVPLIQKECPSARFYVIGDGPLCDEVKKRINEAGVQVGTMLAGMVPNRLIPDYLNQMKLLVLPSYTEGLPTILIEAMACGTPVLATRVGNIPDVIRDGENGFLLDNNSPPCIAERTIEALKGLVTETISGNALCTVASEYSYDLAIRTHREILRSLSLR